MSDWNKLVFAFFKFIGVAILVCIFGSIISACAPKIIEVFKKKLEEKKETSLRNELIQYDTTKLVAEIFYTDILEVLEKEIQKLSPNKEKVIIFLDIKTDNGIVSFSTDYTCYRHRCISFYRDLHKENILKNEFENMVFSDAVAHLLIKRLKSQSFNGAHCDAVKERTFRGEARIIIEIRNSNYLTPPPAQKWKKVQESSQKSPVPPAKPAQSTVPAKTDTKPQPKTQPKKAQPKPTSDSSNDFDFTDDLDEWLKKRSE